MTNKTTIQALESPLTQRHIQDSSTVGTGLACISWINFNELSTSSFNLVRQHLDKAIPRDIVYAFSEMMILNHVVDLQVLDRNYFKSFDNIETCFMQEIMPLVENSFMEFCNFDSSFSSI